MRKYIKKTILFILVLVVNNIVFSIYTNQEIDEIANLKANISGDNLIDIETWRRNLSVMSSDEILRLIEEKANINANNLSPENITAWREKLNVLTVENSNQIIENKVNKDGSNVQSSLFRENLDVYSKNETNKIAENKVNKDGSNVESKIFRENLNVYSKNETNKVANSKANIDGSNIESVAFRKNLDVYSVNETNEQLNKKANIDGSNLSEKDANNFREILNVYSVNETNEKLKKIEVEVDNKVSNVNKNIENYKKESYTGIAGAVAMANLPQAVDPGENGIALSYGNYKGNNAGALGWSGISEGGRVVLKTGVSVDGSENIGLGAGMFIKIGK